MQQYSSDLYTNLHAVKNDLTDEERFILIAMTMDLEKDVVDTVLSNAYTTTKDMFTHIRTLQILFNTDNFINGYL